MGKILARHNYVYYIYILRIAGWFSYNSYLCWAILLKGSYAIPKVQSSDHLFGANIDPRANLDEIWANTYKVLKPEDFS